ncbi:MAG: hypothetical protein M1816_002183 [Peltula sp. TS41687]|nr:MAG: hypothetical protein M1816_002183 [Peltula sp. TS41687]
MTLPPTNSAGTKIETIVRSDYIAGTNYTSVITYPTQFTDNAYFYRWGGVLPTTSNGQSTCITTSDHEELLPTRLAPQGPSPSVKFPEGGGDSGLYARLEWHEKFFDWDAEFYESAYPTLDAFRLCTLPIWAVSPLTEWLAAEFLTETSISHEENAQSTEAPPKQDSTLATSPAQPTVDASSTPTSTPQEESQSPVASATPQDSPSATSTAPPTVDASPTPTSQPQEESQSPVASTTPQDSSSNPPVPSPSADTTSISPLSNEQTNQPTFAIQDPVQSNPIEPSPVETAPSPTISSEENGQIPAAPTNQVPGTTASIAPPVVDVTPAPIGSSGSSASAPAIVPSSAPQSESIPSQDNSFPALNTPVDIPSTTQEQSPASITAQSVDIGATPPPENLASSGSPTSGASNESPAESAAVASPMPAAPTSLSPESAETPPSNQEPTDGIATPAPPTLIIGSNAFTANSATQFEIAPGITVAPGGPAQTFSGTTVSVAPSASFVAVNDVTSALAPPPPAVVTSSPSPVYPVLTIGSNSYTANSATEYEIAPGITVAPGGPAQTVSGTAISLAPSASYIAVNDVTSALSAVSTPEPTTVPPVLTIGGSTYTANSATQYEIAPGVTVAPGGPAGTISGTTISLAPSASYVAINDVTSTLEPASPASITPPVLTIGGSAYTANSATQYEIAPGITVAPGGPAQTVSGTTISLAPSASYIAVNDVTSTLAAVASASPTRQAPPVLTIGGSTYTANIASQYEIAPGITIVPGGSAETISGTTISLAPSASYVAVNGITSTLAAAPLPSPASPTLNFGGSTYTAQSASRYIIEGQTLGLGSTITIGSESSTMVVELQTATNGATELIVGAGNSMSTSTLPSGGAPISLPAITPTRTPPPLTLAGQTYAANSLSQYSLAPDLTLTPGGVVTFSGTEISLAPSASFAVVGSSTETLSAAAETTGAGASGGSGGSGSGSVTSGPSGSIPTDSSISPASVNGAGGRMGQRSTGLGRTWLMGMIVATAYLVAA